MKQPALFILTGAILATSTLSLRAQNEPPPVPMPATTGAPAAPVSAPALAPASAAAWEAMPTLNASEILLPQYLQGANFSVRNQVPTYSGANQFTIDSDFGVFQAAGNAMLMRRVAEIQGIATLQAMSQTDEFTQAAAKAAAAPVGAARDLIRDPVQTITSVPRGIWGFLGQAREAVQATVQGDRGNPVDGNAVENISGFAKTKRDIALKLGVDPYCNNEVFQQELNKVAWPAFLGSFTVRIGMAAVTGGAGAALSGLNWTSTLQASLRDKSPAQLKLLNNNLLTNSIGAAQADADAYLGNPSISPTTQTLTIAALADLGNIPGQAAFIREAATSTDEQSGVAYQQCVQLMAKLNKATPISRISHINGLTVCQTSDGTVVVPIQWDYAAWTEMASSFVAALKAQTFDPPATGYNIMITGVASPTAAKALEKANVGLSQKALPGPLQ